MKIVLLSGKAKIDFHKWAYKTYNNDLFDVDYWNYNTQLEYYSKFFGIEIHDSNSLLTEIEKYNNSQA